MATDSTCWEPIVYQACEYLKIYLSYPLKPYKAGLFYFI